jgi:hypothetical protein
MRKQASFLLIFLVFLILWTIGWSMTWIGEQQTSNKHVRKTNQTKPTSLQFHLEKERAPTPL